MRPTTAHQGVALGDGMRARLTMQARFDLTLL